MATVSDSSLVRVIEPLTTQVTVPVTAEIGPQQPPAETETSEPEPQPAKKNASPVRH